MDGILLLVLLVSYSHGWISGSVLDVTVRPGDNITLYCDCKLSSGEQIVWYRNCSHENQPSLVLNVRSFVGPTVHTKDLLRIIPHFQFVKNDSSASYDLLIMNITDSDEGLYYCGTEKKKLEDTVYRYDYRYGNVTTRIILDSSEPHHTETPQDCSVCWLLLFSLCPTFAVLSSLLSSLMVYHICQKKAKECQVDQQQPETRGQTRLNQMKMCVMLHWKSVSHHKDQRRRKPRVQTSARILPSRPLGCRGSKTNKCKKQKHDHSVSYLLKT